MFKPRILYVQHEIFKWPQAKMWSHNYHLGIEAGFTANGLDSATLVTSWLPAAKELLRGERFDQVWINDIGHAFREGGAGGYQVRESDMEWIAGLASIRVGFVNETIQYPAEEYAANAALLQMREAIEKSAKFMTHILAIDEKDLEFFRSFTPARVLWMVPCMPEEFICREIAGPRIKKGLFIGTPYGSRAKWLQMSELQDLLALQESADNRTDLPDKFNSLHRTIRGAMTGSVSQIKERYKSYLTNLRRIRQVSFGMYLDGLREGAAVVHLPSYCKVYNSRVYEGMAAGRPVITSRGAERPRLDKIFEEGKDLLIYSADEPRTLARHIKTILDEPEYANAITSRAIDKLCRYHTTEKRVRQILEWIETGSEPTYEAKEGTNGSGKREQTYEALSLRIISTDLPSNCTTTSLTTIGKPTTDGDKKPPIIHASPFKLPGGKRKLRILLISPPYARFLDLGNGRFPLSFGALGTMLSMNGHSVGIYDADFDKDLIGKAGTYEYTFSSQEKIREALREKDHRVWKEIEHTIHNFNPDVVGITTMTNKLPMAIKIAEISKSINQDIQVVVGGHHPTMFGPQTLRDRNIDFAVMGEGEITLLELINRLGEARVDFSRISGLSYKEKGRILVNGPRELLCKLDVLPIADRDLMINEGFVSENNVMTSRGCPFHCSYCGAQVIWKRKVRQRSVPQVVREIEYLFQRSPSRNVNFWDDSFTSDRHYIADLMAALKKFEGLKFSCITRLDLVDRETLAKLKERGCSLILFGIESGSDEILQRIDKKITRALIREQTALVRSVGIPWLGFFIMGYPGETREQIRETLAFMKTLDPTYAEINIFNPLPGTRIWAELEEKGLVSNELDFSRYSQASTENYFSNGSMTKEEFRELALFMAREFDAHNRRRNGES